MDKEVIDTIINASDHGSFSELAKSVKNKKNMEETDTYVDEIKPIGLFDELSLEDHARAMELAGVRLKELDAFNKDKNLAKDAIVIPKQKFCVICWVGPKFRAKTEINGFRIMGAFPSMYEASTYAKHVNKLEPMYDSGIVEMNLWCLGYPDSSDIIYHDNGNVNEEETIEGVENTINEYIVKHKIAIEESNKLFEFRKIAVGKSEFKTEGDIENATIKNIPMGNHTQKMEDDHLREAIKWIGGEKTVSNEKFSNTYYGEEEAEEEAEGNKGEYSKSTISLEHECKIKMPEQEYAVISYVGNTGKNCRIPLCVKGIFSNLTEAENHILKLMQFDDTYDILPVPMYKWIPCDPDTSQIRQIYKNKQLNNILETEENQKEESLGYHQSKITGHDLDEPLNCNYAGHGSNPPENIEDVITATQMFKSLSGDISTKSFASVNKFEKDNDDQFKELNDKIKDLEKSIKKLMDDEGIDEMEARSRLRISIDEDPVKTYVEENTEDWRMENKTRIRFN